jgi:acyl-lipid Delta6-acetylenase / acyl-lipid (9-3)-desaturase
MHPFGSLANEIGVDEDMATDPILYTWAPDPSQDSWFRKVQHYIFWIPYSFLFALWRVDSVKAAFHALQLNRQGARSELYSILAHYVILFSLIPMNVFVPAVFLSGIVSSCVVTSTHQSEEKFAEFIPDHVTRQFLCTRSVVMTNPVSAWIWGGMQYQIEHHLFPSMPRSKLPALKPVIQKFAQDNNIEGGYRESGELEILRMNWETYREVALADPVVGAPLSKGREGQQAAIAEGFTAVHPYQKKP